MKRYHAPLGRCAEIKHEHPERTASRNAGPSWDAEIEFQVWPNRAAMARTVRMQERRASDWRDWRPLVKLEITEGY
jgi:hypothetical protein